MTLDEIRATRNILLSNCDYMLMSDYVLEQYERDDVLAYRIMLRDITDGQTDETADLIKMPIPQQLSVRAKLGII